MFGGRRVSLFIVDLQTNTSVLTLLYRRGTIAAHHLRCFILRTHIPLKFYGLPSALEIFIQILLKSGKQQVTYFRILHWESPASCLAISIRQSSGVLPNFASECLFWLCLNSYDGETCICVLVAICKKPGHKC